MEKRKTIIITIIGIILLGIAVVLGKDILKPDETITDAMKFKEEYESLNDTVRKSDGEKYISIEIDENNPIKYIDAKKAIEVLDEEKAVIYVGANWCPWCRNAVPVLLDIAKDYEVDTIYYLNLDEEKSTWEVIDGKATKTKDGSDDYYKLLEKLKDQLRDYTLNDKNGKKLETGEKRIYMPLVLGINNGKVVEKHQGTVELEKDQTANDALTTQQYEELYKSYNALFNKVFKQEKDTCNVGEYCE